MPRLPQPRFAAIAADPPWPYDNSGDKWAIPKNVDGTDERAVGHLGYNTMTMEQLKALPVVGLAETNAHLYLWTTNAFLVEAHDLARAWGFKPKTMLTWGKVGPNGVSMKTGYYFRGATEHCLFCVRGSLRLISKFGEPNLYLSRRLPHSVKPDWFYKLVERCSPGPRLELFARRRREGWSHWGNEVKCDVELA